MYRLPGTDINADQTPEHGKARQRNKKQTRGIDNKWKDMDIRDWELESFPGYESVEANQRHHYNFMLASAF